MKLAIIIPALNEGATIGDVVRRSPRDIPGVDAVEVIVIDDGSTDDTAEAARLAGADVISHSRNEGVGAAFATGVRAALERQVDLVVNMDGDGQFQPEDIPRLIRPILEEGAGFVTCSRFADPNYVPQMPRIKRWGNRWMTRLIRWISGVNHFTDVSCGFRAYTRDTLLRLNLYGRYTYTQETFIALAAHHVRMAEVPLRVRGTREFGRSRVADNLPRYVWKTVPIILRTMRDVRPFLFFGTLAAMVFLIGVGLGGFVFTHWLLTGRTHPYQSLITGSAVGLILGFLLFVVALVADMFNRMRRLLEELLYLARRQHYARSDTSENAEGRAAFPSGKADSRMSSRDPSGQSVTLQRTPDETIRSGV
jgi:glycosyltransferase involved in cell wall biosynthesis